MISALLALICLQVSPQQPLQRLESNRLKTPVLLTPQPTPAPAPAPGAAQAGPAGRTYVASNYFLNLDGVKTGFVRSVEGGVPFSEVVAERTGASYYSKKHIAGVRYEPFTVQIGFSMSRAVYDWIASSWQMNYQRKNGAIVVCDYKLDAQAQREFFNALITETTIPAMDGSSKEPGYLTMKFAPEYTRFSKASGKPGAFDSVKSTQKLWLPSNFRLEIAGLDCTRVNKIDSFTVKQSVTTDDIGDARDRLKEPGKLEFPNLKISLPEAYAQTWQAWFDDFVVKGNAGDNNEKNGAIVFLAPNRSTELLRIKLYNLGIIKLTPEKSEPSSDQIRRVTAELYCERMEFAYFDKVIGDSGAVRAASR